jgi:tetratricopeptide (TPR) repeat protein
MRPFSAQIASLQNATRRPLLILSLSVFQFSAVHASDLGHCGLLLMDKPSLPACHRVIQGTDPKALKVIAHVNLAADYFKRRLYDEAIQEYSIAIRLEPESSAKGLFFGLRAHAMERSGRIDAAIADLDDASRLNQNQAFSYLDRRDALLEKQRAKRQALDVRKAAVPERAQKAVEARDQEKQLREQRSQQETAQIAAIGS